jgi:hypothetical protein
MTRSQSDAAKGASDGAAAALAAEPEESATGLDAAIQHFRSKFGDDVVTLWRTSGPRKSHTDEVACILAEIGDYPRKVVIQSFTSGAFKVFAEVAGKTPDQMTDALIEQYAPA